MCIRDRCIVVIVINHRDFVAEVVLEAIGERGLSEARAAEMCIRDSLP